MYAHDVFSLCSRYIIMRTLAVQQYILLILSKRFICAVRYNNDEKQIYRN